MNNLVPVIEAPEEITCAAQRLAEVARETVPARMILDVFERWGGALESARADQIPGLPFLRLWFRRGTLEPMVCRELGPDWLQGSWHNEGEARIRAFPVGVVGHWPAGNIEIQPILSLTCALLGGNSCLVRVPDGLAETMRHVMNCLADADPSRLVLDRIFLASFPHWRIDLQTAMAQAVDGAVIWGGAESVSRVRALPFPPWTRIAVFGPRLSVAAMDADTWSDPVERAAWCRRLARDVWQFDQAACSSPQALFLEHHATCPAAEFVEDLRCAFEQENRLHPRKHIEPALASRICLARASWLLADAGNHACFPQAPDWTILHGRGTDIPSPTQGRTLSLLETGDLAEVIAKFDGSVQTLALAVKDPRRLQALAESAALHGVDRIVKLGRMHVFSSPWDGMDLVRPMVRLVRAPNWPD